MTQDDGGGGGEGAVELKMTPLFYMIYQNSTLPKYLFIWYLFTLGHHNSHNPVSNTLSKKREPSKYNNTMKACDGLKEVYFTL